MSSTRGAVPHAYNPYWGRGHQQAISRLLCLGFFSPACSRSSSRSWCQPPPPDYTLSGCEFVLIHQLAAVCLLPEAQRPLLTNAYYPYWITGHQQAISRLLCLGLFSPAGSRSFSQSLCQPPCLGTGSILDDLLSTCPVVPCWASSGGAACGLSQAVSYPAPSPSLHIMRK